VWSLRAAWWLTISRAASAFPLVMLEGTLDYRPNRTALVNH
jgi:hypothetical protein